MVNQGKQPECQHETMHMVLEIMILWHVNNWDTTCDASENDSWKNLNLIPSRNK